MARKPSQQKSASTARKIRATKKPAGEKLFRMIQETAYLKAEKDGFAKDPTSYWLNAESEIYLKHKLKKG
jgi:hypothetical protein